MGTRWRNRRNRKAYTFHEKELGTYSITIRASNIDGETIRDFDVEVVETMPYSVRFPTPSYTQTSTDRYTFAGRPVYLRPLLEYFDYPQYQWQVNGKLWKPLPTGFLNSRRRLLENISLLLLLQKNAQHTATFT